MTIKRNTSWFRVHIIDQHAMTRPISGQFSQLVTALGVVSVVQFLVSDVYRKAFTVSCTAHHHHHPHHPDVSAYCKLTECIMDYITAAGSICLCIALQISEQFWRKPDYQNTQTDSRQILTQNGFMQVIYLGVNEKPLSDYVLQYNAALYAVRTFGIAN